MSRVHILHSLSFAKSNLFIQLPALTPRRTNTWMSAPMRLLARVSSLPPTSPAHASRPLISSLYSHHWKTVVSSTKACLSCPRRRSLNTPSLAPTTRSATKASGTTGSPSKLSPYSLASRPLHTHQYPSRKPSLFDYSLSPTHLG